MTLSQIMMLALRQLDEDPQDISEYDELFRVYANMGYRIAIGEHIKPRRETDVRSDENGVIAVSEDWVRVVELKRKLGDRSVNALFELDATGQNIVTLHPESDFHLVVEVRGRDMENGTDEPEYLPEEAHHALVDYICYRHLMNGNMAKQSRAQQYLQAFYQAMQRLRPQGFGSVTGYRNLYAASDIRWTR